MKKLVFRLLLSCFLVAVGLVKNAEAQSYSYTSSSKRFFTSSEINELLYNAAKDVFEYNKVPENVLKNNFETIQPLLLSEIKPGVIKQFKTIEFYNEQGIRSAVDSKPYNTVKKQYIKYFSREVEQAFLRSQPLRKYLSFNTSDRISFFKSDVTIQTNGKLLVTETITVYNGDGEKGPNATTFADEDATDAGDNNDQIKRGIVRTFPTIYVGDYKLFYNTSFKVLKVERKDDPMEQWQVKKQANGYALYIGKSDYFLPNGFYTYSITYETEHQLKHLQNEDQLAWNITGNGWNFRIDSASCTIHLPKGAEGTDFLCATGLQGSTAQDCNYIITYEEGGMNLYFKTSRPLLPYEGISASVAFTKGIVATPSFIENVWWLFMGNKPVFILPLLIILLIGYYYSTWRRVGKDPAPGNIIPEFTPPADLSPAAVGYVYFQDWNNKMVNLLFKLKNPFFSLLPSASVL